MPRQVTFGGHDFLYVNPVLKGQVIPLERNGGGEHNYGGDKVWPCSLIYSLSVAPGTQTLLGARSLVLGWVSTLTYWRPPLFLGTARKTR
jgi:hypothetical protein